VVSGFFSQPILAMLGRVDLSLYILGCHSRWLSFLQSTTITVVCRAGLADTITVQLSSLCYHLF
jgi:hypothetical protein